MSRKSLIICLFLILLFIFIIFPKNLTRSIGLNKDLDGYINPDPEMSTDIEPNDDFNEAIEIFSGELSDRRSVNATDIYDYYKIYLTPFHFLKAQMFSNNGLSLNLRIYNTTFNEVNKTTSSGFGWFEIQHIPTQNGYYYICIENNSMSQAEYQLRAMAYIDNEPNNNFDQAHEVNDGESGSGFSSSSDSDFFKIYLNQLEILIIDAGRSGGDNFPLTIYNPNRDQVNYSIIFSSSNSIRHVARETGFYYFSFGSWGSSEYYFKISIGLCNGLKSFK
ncbi:hypothetical protein ES703_110410 [subsurface metagenome]